MAGVSDELVAALNHHAFLTAKALDALMARTQLREAMRTPARWAVSSIGLTGTENDAWQLCTRNPSRAHVVIVNNGTNGALVGPTAFNVAEAQRQYTEYKNNASTLGCFLLKAGTTIKLETTGPVFVSSATGTDTRVEALEFIYDVESNVLPIATSAKKPPAEGGINLQAVAKELA